jgi:hypothetical protein
MRIPLRVFLRLVIVAFLIAAVLTAWGLLRGDLTFHHDAAPSPSGATTSSSTQGSGARGCLGGENAEAAAASAQEQAPLTPTGAAEFSASLIRWYWMLPRSKPLTADGPALWVPGVDTSLTTPQWPNAGNGDTAYASFLNGHYLIESATTSTVVVSAEFTSIYSKADGSIESENGVEEMTLVAFGGHWRLKTARIHRQAQDVIEHGQPYVQGC